MGEIAALTEDWPATRVALVASRLDGTEVARSGPVSHTFELASVTKLLTALAVHIAIEEGSIGPASAAPTGERVDDLLAHASGVGPDGGSIAPPRTRRIYSNSGYERLAHAVTEATGMAFEAYLDAALSPIGPGSVTLDGGSPAHGARGNATDLHRCLLHLAGPGLLAAETVDGLRTPFIDDLEGVLPGFGQMRPNPWGLGPEIRGTKSPHWTGTGNSPSTYGHFGAAGSFCWIDPALDVMLVCLTDHEFGGWARARWPALGDGILDAYEAL